MQRFCASIVVLVLFYIATSAATAPKKIDLAANMDDWKERVKKAMAGETAAKEEPEYAEDGPIADCFMVVQ